MDALRVGGIVSGLDTNGIIDSLMMAAKQPIVNLQKQVTVLSYQKSVYNTVISAMNSMKNSLLPLKMESTFKNKTVSSSTQGIASATGGINTPSGTYNLNVTQLAKNASVQTLYPQLTLFSGNTNISSITERATAPKYINQPMGMHTISIEEKAGVGAIATDKFTADGKTFDKFEALATDPAYFSNTGNLLQNINGKLNFKVNVDGVDKNVEVNLNYSATPTKYMQEIAYDIETQINSQLGITGENQVFVKTELSANNKMQFAFYSTNEKPITITTVTGGANDVSSALGVGTLSSAGSKKEMVQQVISDNLTNLQTKITAENGGLIPGLKIAVKTGETLKAGVSVLNYDDTINRKVASKSTFFGKQFSKFGVAGTSYSRPQIDQWLNSSLNSTNVQKMKPDGTTDSGTIPSFFDKVGSTDTTNGFFTLNGVKITIDNAGKLTPNELMAKINSSGAGVTARFDYESNTFMIENNNKGSTDIQLGSPNDTSDVLSVLGVAITSGATYVRGNDAGTLSLTATLDKAGFSTAVTAGIFTINGVSIYVDPLKDTVGDVINKVNKSGANVTISYDSYTDKFKIEANGSTSRIEVGGKNDTSNFLQSIGITKGASTDATFVGNTGNKAKFTFNGVEYERDSNNNIKDVLSDMNLNLLSLGSTTISVAVDTDKAIDAMADFAVNYNKLMDMLTPSLPDKETKDKYWEILTDDKKANMSDDDIKTYNENHMRIRNIYIIAGSSELRTLKGQIRSTLMDPTSASPKYKKISDVGLNIAGAAAGDYKLTQKGLFVSDTTDKDTMKKVIKDLGVFNNILANEPDEMYKFFTDKSTTTANGTTTTKYNGWGVKYDDFATRNSNSTSILFKKAGIGGVIESQISKLQDQIETQTTRANQYLERMWNEFANMENRIQQIQSQASALSKIGGGGATA